MKTNGNITNNFLEVKISKISCGGHHSLILTNNGFLYSCGYGYHG